MAIFPHWRRSRQGPTTRLPVQGCIEGNNRLHRGSYLIHVGKFAFAQSPRIASKSTRRVPMRTTRIFLLVMAWVLVFAVGCRKDAVDKMAFKSALNSYYSGRQDCLWNAPVKFPAQADTSNDEQTRSYDALTDVGLLTRKA